jgi:hypothetical protein
MNIKVENKVSILSNTLAEFFGVKMNLAHITFFGQCISAITAEYGKTSKARVINNNSKTD